MKGLPAIFWFLGFLALRADESVPFSPGTEAARLSTAAETWMDYDYSKPDTSESFTQLRDAWLKERDPVKRAEAAKLLVAAAIWDQNDEGDSREEGMIDEVARDGRPQHVLTASSTETVKIDPKFTFPASQDPKDMTGDQSLLFRRITGDRFEVWRPTDGWLFDGAGRMIVHAAVPRRDGNGRDWYGAFLEDGTWLTTDLWQDDQQLNAFSPDGKWKWEIAGADLVEQAVKEGRIEGARGSFGWARADKTGKQWLVSVGADRERGYALVEPDKKVTTLPATANFWGLVYPSAMGCRGEYGKAWIINAEGTRTLVRTGTYHNIGVEWPIYSLPRGRIVIVRNGSLSFGFGPDGQEVWISDDATDPAPLTWFFGPTGAYDGQAVASYLGPAADGHGLLLEDAHGLVMELNRRDEQLAVSRARSFIFSDGAAAKPLAIFDDLGLGIFQRATGGDIVLGRW